MNKQLEKLNLHVYFAKNHFKIGHNLESYIWNTLGTIWWNNLFNTECSIEEELENKS